MRASFIIFVSKTSVQRNKVEGESMWVVLACSSAVEKRGGDDLCMISEVSLCSQHGGVCIFSRRRGHDCKLVTGIPKYCFFSVTIFI